MNPTAANIRNLIADMEHAATHFGDVQLFAELAVRQSLDISRAAGVRRLPFLIIEYRALLLNQQIDLARPVRMHIDSLLTSKAAQ